LGQNSKQKNFAIIIHMCLTWWKTKDFWCATVGFCVHSIFRKSQKWLSVALNRIFNEAKTKSTTWLENVSRMVFLFVVCLRRNRLTQNETAHRSHSVTSVHTEVDSTGRRRQNNGWRRQQTWQRNQEWRSAGDRIRRLRITSQIPAKCTCYHRVLAWYRSSFDSLFGSHIFNNNMKTCC